MALTGWRWVTIAILGCCALVAVYWPGSTDTTPSSRSYFTLMSEIHQGNRFRDMLVRETRTMHTLLQLRDAAIAALERSSDRNRPVSIWLSSDARRTTLARMSQASATVTDLLDPMPTGSQTILLSEGGAAERRIGLADSFTNKLYGTWFFTPRATNGRVCLAVARGSMIHPLELFLKDSTNAPARDARAALLRALGPCSFYAAFGVPGSHIEQWLQEHNYAFAVRADWDSTDVPYQIQGDPDFQEVKNDEDLSLNGLSLISLLSIARNRLLAMGNLSLSARACAHRQLAQCQTLLFSRQLDPPPPLAGRYAIGRRWWDANDPEAVFLSDIVRAQGRERFIRFWRSDLPVEQAFQETFGVSIEEWTNRWLLGQMDHPHFGPTVRWSSVVVGLLLALTVAAGTGVVAWRRQVA